MAELNANVSFFCSNKWKRRGSRRKMRREKKQILKNPFIFCFCFCLAFAQLFYFSSPSNVFYLQMNKFIKLYFLPFKVPLLNHFFCFHVLRHPPLLLLLCIRFSLCLPSSITFFFQIILFSFVAICRHPRIRSRPVLSCPVLFGPAGSY